MRHKEVNKLIRHGLDQDKIPSTLEPIGLSRRGDKKRKDGLTYPTCKNEKWLIWDFTSADSLSKSYVKKSFYISGLCSSWKRRQKVENIAICQIITILCPGTYGTYSPQGIKLVKKIGNKIQDATGEKLSTFYLYQSISISIQKDNAVCVMGCPKDIYSGLEGLFNFQVHEAEEP